MIKKMYGIKDDYTGFISLVMADNDAVASRDFISACSDKTSYLGNEDTASAFHLYCFGTIDIDTGVVVSDLYPVANAIDYLMNKKNLKEK
nr:MAG: nonstructural protein [Microvirus Sku115]